MSLNSFITSLLMKFDEWDRLADKFGMVTFPDDVLTSMLEELEDDRIERLARKCGASIPRAIMEFWFSHVTPEAFLKYLTLRMNYQHFVNHEVTTSEEGRLVITARHERGRKWSIWSCNYLAEAIKVNFGEDCQFEINGNTYRLECPDLATIKVRA